jgi:hypothetical protein
MHMQSTCQECSALVERPALPSRVVSKRLWERVGERP